MLQHSNLIQRAIRDSQGRFTGKYEIVEEKKRNKTPGAYVPGVKGWAFLVPFILVNVYVVLNIGGQI
jgi:hypothetical protein